MVPGRYCGRCRCERPIEWQQDRRFGPDAESARCPLCGELWGVRARRMERLRAAEQMQATQRTREPASARG